MLIFLTKATRTKLLVFLCLCLVIVGARAGMELSGELGQATGARVKPITRVNTSRPEVALMIDVVNANPEAVQELKQALAQAQIRATWFVSATWVEQNVDLVTALSKDGHEIGVKAQDEGRVDRLDAQEIKARLLRAREAVAKAQVEAAPFFYPSGSKLGDPQMVTALEEGFQTVFGSADLRKIKGKPEDISKRLNLMPGDIALVEVSGKTQRPPASSVEIINSWAKLHGLSFVRMSDLIRGVR